MGTCVLRIDESEMGLDLCCRQCNGRLCHLSGRLASVVGGHLCITLGQGCCFSGHLSLPGVLRPDANAVPVRPAREVRPFCPSSQSVLSTAQVWKQQREKLFRAVLSHSLLAFQLEAAIPGLTVRGYQASGAFKRIFQNKTKQNTPSRTRD